MTAYSHDMRLLVTSLLCSFCTVALGSTPTIKSIQAMLHKTSDGTFSYDLLKSGALGNGVLSYNGILLTVEISSESTSTIVVRMVSSSPKKKTLVSSKFQVTGTAFLPVLYTGSLCDPANLEVLAVEGKREQLLKKELLVLGPCHE